MANKLAVPARPKKSEYIGVSVDEETRLLVQQLAAERDVSMSRIALEALHEYLRRRKLKARAA